MAKANKGSNTEKVIAEVIQNRYKKLTEDTQPIFDEVEIFHQMYRAFLNQDDTYPWDYNLVDPVVFQLLRSMMARLNPENFRVQLDARNSQALAYRDKNQAFLNWELEEMQKTLVFYRFLFRGLLAGRSYMSTGWKFTPALQIKTGEAGKKENTRIMRDIVNRAIAKNVRFQDILVPNQNNPELDEQPYVVERMMLNFGEMMDDNAAAEEAGQDIIWKPDYIKKIKEKRMFDNKMDYMVDLPQDDDVKGLDAKTDDIFIRSQYIAVLKMQTSSNEVYYVPEHQKEWVLNEKCENPYWHGHYPYITFTPFPEDDDYYSMGIVQPVADLQIALSSALNQFLTSARKAGNPMWIKGKDAAGTPDWMFVSRPDGVITVAGDAEQIKQITSKDTSEVMIRARQELKTTLESTTSLSSLYSSGVSGGSGPQVNRTATGAKIIDANIDINMQMLVSLFGAMSLSVLGNHFMELNVQYLDEEQEFKLTGEETFQKVAPAEVTANFNVIVNPDTITKVSPVIKQAQLLNLKATVDQEKDIKLNKKPIWEGIVRSYPELNIAPSDIFVDPEKEAMSAMESIMGGTIPKVKFDQDHKAIITIIQKEIATTEAEISDEQLKMFAEYLDEHRAYEEAAKPQNAITLIPPQPEMLPPDEAALMEQMGGQVTPPTNPTQALPQTIPAEALIA